MKIKPISSTELHTEIEVREIDIIADDGRVLFTVYENPDGGLEISSGGFVKHNDVILDNGLEITPRSSNIFTVSRKVYK